MNKFLILCLESLPLITYSQGNHDKSVDWVSLADVEKYYEKY